MVYYQDPAQQAAYEEQLRRQRAQTLAEQEAAAAKAAQTTTTTKTTTTAPNTTASPYQPLPPNPPPYAAPPPGYYFDGFVDGQPIYKPTGGVTPSQPVIAPGSPDYPTQPVVVPIDSGPKTETGVFVKDPETGKTTIVPFDQYDPTKAAGYKPTDQMLNQQLNKLDVESSLYTTALSSFDQRWGDKVQDGQFNGTDAEWEQI